MSHKRATKARARKWSAGARNLLSLHLMDSCWPDLGSPSASPMPLLLILSIECHEDEPALSEELQMVLHVAKVGAFKFGKILIDAKNLDDFEDRLDEIVMDPSFMEFNNFALTMLTADVYAAVHEDGAPDLSGVLGKEASTILRQASPAFVELLKAQIQLLNKPKLPARTGRKPLRSAEDLLTNVPPEVSAVFLASLKATACILGLCAAKAKGDTLAEWLAVSLAAHCVSGHFEMLRFLAAIPGIDVDSHVLPPEAHVDIPGVYRRAELVEKGYKGALAAAESSGRAVYPLIPDEDAS